MFDLVLIGALVAVLVVGVVVLVRRPADSHRLVRWSALAITVLVAAALTPYTVEDSGAAASYLLGVPVGGALVPVLAQRLGRWAAVADAIAAAVIVGWGLLLALGVGIAFLPAAMLLIGSAVTGRPAPARRAF